LNTRDFEEKEELQEMLNFSTANPFPATHESFEDDYHVPAPRRPSAAVHPEDKE